MNIMFIPLNLNLTNTRILSSGAFDFHVCIWDVSTQHCLKCINLHTQPIYTICFSPNGEYFVTGGIDKKLYVWRTCDSSLIADYDANCGMFEAHWDPTGNSIAMCLANSNVAVIFSKDIFNREWI